MPESLPTINGLTPPSSPLLDPVLAYLRKHTSLATVNHCIRPLYFMQILTQKLPPFQQALSAGALNLETAMLALLMHDLGWATTKELISKDKRFEVDGAELAVKFIQDNVKEYHVEGDWDQHRLEEIWTSIAIHTIPTIGQHHPNPAVGLVGLCIIADFFGPNLPPPVGSGVITDDEYKAILKAFPREGFREDMVSIMCGLCREKPETTYDNFVSEFGRKYGTDGRGGGKEEFIEKSTARSFHDWMMSGLDKCEELEREI